MKKIIGTLVIVGAVIIAAYLYITAPVPVPTTDIQSVTNTLKPLTNATTVYRISKEGSRVEFQLNELLRGTPKLVIGTSTQIAGDIGVTNSLIDFGEIKIDARTLETDDGKRNGAIARLILKSTTAGNEYIVVKQISNDFQGTISQGQEIKFVATADLTISGVTKLTKFDITMKVVGDTLTGTAKATIKRADFGIKVPEFDFIANVDDAVVITAKITAKQVVQ